MKVIPVTLTHRGTQGFCSGYLIVREKGLLKYYHGLLNIALSMETQEYTFISHRPKMRLIQYLKKSQEFGNQWRMAFVFTCMFSNTNFQYFLLWYNWSVTLFFHFYSLFLYSPKKEGGLSTPTHTNYLSYSWCLTHSDKLRNVNLWFTEKEEWRSMHLVCGSVLRFRT